MWKVCQVCLGCLAIAASFTQVEAQPPQLPSSPPDPPVIRDCPTPEEIRTQFKPMDQIRAGLQLEGKQLPPDCSEGLFQDGTAPAPRIDAIREFHWEPMNFFHHPLYFDDVPLERYGQSVCPTFQPVISGARFFITFPALPYKMGVDRPHDCVTPLGLYRPGSCAPCMREALPPLECDAALFETAVALGMVFLLP
jgi:hypothetical protein